MIIRLIAETAEERDRFTREFGSETVEHQGVREYFLFGNKVDPDNDLIDFREWKGSNRYLLSSLSYFYEILNDDRRNIAEKSKSAEIRQRMIKHGEVREQNLAPIDVDSVVNPEPKNTPEREKVDNLNVADVDRIIRNIKIGEKEIRANLDKMKESTLNIPEPPTTLRLVD